MAPFAVHDRRNDHDASMRAPNRAVGEAIGARWTAMWNGEVELANAIIAEGFHAHLTSKKLVDPKEMRDPSPVMDWVRRVRASFESIHYETNLAVIVDGDLIAARWFATGVHAGRTGRPNDVAGRPFRLAGTDVLRIEGGRIREWWTLTNPIEP
jgi:hypothetical protein